MTLVPALAQPEAAGFVASWDDLPLDPYLAHAGRYRRRRHAVLLADGSGRRERLAHRPHYQAPEYNSLFGGVERWFEPIHDATLAHPACQAILDWSSAVFLRSARAAAVEMELHQFRIEARPASPGQPTPEGMHRDGVDFVLVLMIRRQNIAEGTTLIHSTDNRLLESFTLAAPWDAALIDDRRVQHGVTAVDAIDPLKPAFRDVLVVTFRQLSPPSDRSARA